MFLLHTARFIHLVGAQLSGEHNKAGQTKLAARRTINTHTSSVGATQAPDARFSRGLDGFLLEKTL